jgi:uncharacterized protein YkwD
MLTGCGSGKNDPNDKIDSISKITYTNPEKKTDEHEQTDSKNEEIKQTPVYEDIVQDTAVENISDTSAPVIILVGEKIVNLTQGDNYTDAGAIAHDEIDGKFKATIKSNDINTQIIGTYHIIYTAKDQAGNIAKDVIRTVVVNKKPNNVPTATSQTITLDEDTDISIVLSGVDADQDLLTYRVTVEPSHGTYIDGIYTPVANYYGNDSFRFVANDGKADSEPATVNIMIIDIAEPAYQCPATATTESKFIDIFVENNQTDRDWKADLQKTITVEQIAAEFNAARATDPTITETLVMPSQAEWNSYTDSEKALYLINSERCARGIRVFEGIDTSIVAAPAQKYADYLKENNAWGHQEDGRTPWKRLEEDAGVNIGSNADFFSYAENLAYISVGSTEKYPSVYEPVAISVYGWLYDDKDDTKSEYGHRKFLLATGLKENFGETNKEGLIGVGVSTLQYNDGTYNMTKVYTVLNAFDPNENWENGANIIKVDIEASQ